MVFHTDVSSCTARMAQSVIQPSMETMALSSILRHVYIRYST